MELTRSRTNVTGLILKALSLVLGFWFVGSGMTKLLRVESQVQNFERWGYPDWFLILTGVIELTAAILLIVSVVYGRVATIGALLIAGVMCGALYIRIANDDAVSTIIPPLVLLIVAVIVAWFRRNEMLARP
jgi:putative oxidoreductase